MARFTQPTQGNCARIGSPVNSVRNLQRKLNRQARAAKLERELED
jgi:hypothetical protein